MEFPVDVDFTEGGDEVSGDPGEFSAGFRGDEEVFKARVLLIGVNPEDDLEEELSNGAEGEMIKGSHERVLEGFSSVRGEAIPAFPDGGGVVEDHVEPGGYIFVE